MAMGFERMIGRGEALFWEQELPMERSILIQDRRTPVTQMLGYRWKW